MLRIKIELVPYGDEERKTTISEFTIVNNRKVKGDKSEYYYKGFYLAGTVPEVSTIFYGTVRHQRWLNVIHLVAKVISDILSKEK